MKKLMILLTAIFLTSSVVTVVIAVTTTPTEISYTPKMGVVTFNHSTHQELTDCVTCHHTGDYAQCKSCHGVEENAPKAKNAYHKQCKDCHKEMKKGPTRCKECHIK
ncbi:MAG: cytochrome c3 family protein [Thermodesulfobacteriota bacterium]|nr:cytochrome c3 family protein [Thermodesulfobacteriota bacterium]